MMLAALLLQAAPVADLDAELLAARSATAVLQKRCAEPIRAVVDGATSRPPSEETRARLHARADERIAYRSVRLMCGSRLFSRADNWYVPARLHPEMNAALEGDTPFGVAIRALSPTRRTVGTERLSGGGEMLRHRAIVLGGAGEPLAEVVETYSEAVLAAP